MKTKGGREQAGAGPALPWLAVAGLAGIVRSCRIGGGDWRWQAAGLGVGSRPLTASLAHLHIFLSSPPLEVIPLLSYPLPPPAPQSP